jgi:hypothetical protein
VKLFYNLKYQNMKYPLILFLLITSYGATPPIPAPPPVMITIPVKPSVVVLPTLIQESAPAPVGDDWSPVFQKGIDSCIQNNIPVYFIPQGRYICRKPLILQKYGTPYYNAFSLIIQGTSTFAGADGSGTILDFTSMTSGFGIGIQGGKGVEIKGLKLIGAWNYKFPGAYAFYNTDLGHFTDGKCRDTQYSPYFAIVIDPFGPSIPGDGGYPGLSAYYKGSRNGSTGTVIEDCYFTNWVGGIITSPNGKTQNADITVGDKLQFGNMKICVAGCQDQEKMNHISNVMAWGVIHTCFATGLYGAGSPGNWYLDHWNIAGYTNQIVYNNQTGYFPSYFSDIFAESIARIGPIYSINGTTFSNSTINFAGFVEAGSYTEGMISGYGVTYVGCQLRVYGQWTPITINSLEGLLHFRDCSFDVVPFYPQTYANGYTDFQNCTIAVAGNPGDILNPMGPQTIRADLPVYAYGVGSNVAGKVIRVDGLKHKFSKTGPKLTSVIQSDSSVKVGDIIVATPNYVDYRVAGIISAVGTGNFTVAYSPVGVDTSKSYSLYRWTPVKK